MVNINLDFSTCSTLIETCIYTATGVLSAWLWVFCELWLQNKKEHDCEM